MTRAARGPLSVLLIVLGALAFAVADVSHYADRNVFSAGRFADHGTAALDDRAVRTELADIVAAQAIRASPDLANVRPLLQATVSGIAATPAFQGLVRTALQDVHRAVLSGDRDTTSLRLVDAGSLVHAALERFAPKAAAKVPEGLDVTVLRLTDSGAGGVATDAAQAANRNATLLRVSFGLAALLLGAAVVVAPDRRRACWRAAIALGVACAAIAGAFLVGRAWLAALGTDADASAAIRGGVTAYFGGLRDLNVYLAGAAAVVALAVAAPVRTVEPVAWLRRLAGRAATPPAGTAGRAVRAAGLILVGALVVLHPRAVLQMAVTAAGGLAVLVGVGEAMRLVLPAEGIERLDVSPPRLRLRRGVTAGLAALLAVGAGGVALARSGDDATPFRLTACNGSASLCDRRIDQVTFPGTHNSMGAASEPGWLFASQQDGIPQQLGAGVRALFIDTHYGVRTPRGVATVLGRGTKSREKLEGALGPVFLAAVERARKRIGYDGGGTRRVYLCHAFCEVGATDAARALASVRDFLVANPGEVVVIGLEDQVTPADTAKVFARSGLLDLVYRGPVRPLPTLRQMIDDGGRVLVMSEERTGDVPWLRDQYAITQETPFEFSSVSRLEASASCDEERGEPSNPLFLVNHWVDTSPAPRTANARKANSRAVLLGRARRCARVRGRMPNFLSVDLYRDGDLFGVARELNRERARPRND